MLAIFRALLTMPPAIFAYCASLHLIAQYFLPQKITTLAIILSSIFFIIFLIFALGALWLFALYRINPAPCYNNDKIFFNIGIYRLSRNPMYLSLLALLLSVGCICFPFLLCLTPLAFVYLVNKHIKSEEDFLRKAFPNVYPLYEKHTPRWLI